MLRNVAQIPEHDRPWVLESGVKEVDSAAPAAAEVDADVVPRLAVMFGGGRSIRLGGAHAAAGVPNGGATHPGGHAGLRVSQGGRTRASCRSLRCPDPSA
jgi:hypothetical protein